MLTQWHCLADTARTFDEYMSGRLFRRLLERFSIRKMRLRLERHRRRNHHPIQRGGRKWLLASNRLEFTSSLVKKHHQNVGETGRRLFSSSNVVVLLNHKRSSVLT
ncbi:hypothetical protein KIN20_004716 [Parelaphostrongylus tenuis]|uniref:Uncharacterized protein n=1 Tax=Parelaphostrongylus tenuis TaxID=148309 RepID=A0AAD5QI65_PARTN|nr:hypothetical protein KIN20_004716 [Parelaphostrongylus tenuis]